MPHPAMLRIVKYDKSEGVYLFYCDPKGVEYTDTWHDTVEKAMEQAQVEFRVRTDEWVDAK